MTASSSLRLLPSAAADGPANMAADEALLENAQRGEFAFRLYRWSPATLSLGYFQPAAERLKNPAWRELPWVRRATGGGAILHDEEELTYAVALPPAVAKEWGHAEWHCLFHRLMVDLLREAGVEAELVGGARHPPSELDFLCFVVPQPADVEWEGRKIIGGAQRLRGGALLQHGSILPPAAEILGAKLPEALGRRFGLPVEARDWSSAERQHIAALAKEKFSSDAWSLKR